MKATSRVSSSIEDLASRYNDAWCRGNIDEILSMQTKDSKFIIHGAQNVMQWAGIDACRESYEYLMRAWPDFRFHDARLVTSKNFWACHQKITATLALPWQMGGRTYQPTGKPVTWEIVDIVQCEGNLVKVKEGWIDGLAIHKQLSGEA